MSTLLTRAIIYCRASSPKQARQWETLQEQEKECREFCKKNNIKVIAVLREQFTGTEANRPKLDEAIQFCKADWSIDFCIISKIDRGTRGWAEDLQNIKERFWEANVLIKDVQWIIQKDSYAVEHVGWVDFTKYEWNKKTNYWESVVAQQAKEERKIMLQRTLPQEARNEQEGYSVRPAPYGLSNKRDFSTWLKKTIYIPHITEAPFIKMMFDLKRQGLPQKEICRQVNLAGYRSRVQKRWSKDNLYIIWERWGVKLKANRLSELLQNTIYCWYKSTAWTTWYVRAEGDFIVSVSEWNEANRGKRKIIIDWCKIRVLHGQELRDQFMPKRRRKFDPRLPYRGTILSSNGQETLTGSFSKWGNGTAYGNYHSKPKDTCKRENYSKKVLEKNVESFLKDLKMSPAIEKIFKLKLKKAYHKNIDLFEEKSNILERKLQDLLSEKQKRKRAILEIDIQNKTLLDLYSERLEEVSKEITEIRAELSANISKSKTDYREFEGFCMHFLKNPIEIIKKADSKEEIEVLFRMLFTKVPRYSEIVNRTAPLFPILRSVMQKNTHKKVSVSDWIPSWQPRSESN